MNTGTIIRNIKNGALARITHWNHMWVDRSTGKVWDNAFVLEYLTGKREGQRYVEKVDGWETAWERVWTTQAGGELQ